MILLVGEKQKNVLKKSLSPYFKVSCVCYEYFEIESLKKDTFDVIVFNFKHYDDVKSKLVFEVLENYPTIPIICLSDNEIDRFCEMKNVIVLPTSNYKILKKKLKGIIFRELDWDKKIQEVKNYINKNICSIDKVEQITNKFNINRRKLSSEFKLKSGKSIESFIIDVKFNLIKDILSKTEELGNYYKIARDCGLENDRTLYILIKRKTGKTTKEFHEELLRTKFEKL